jgi:hypothetical protein
MGFLEDLASLLGPLKKAGMPIAGGGLANIPEDLLLDISLPMILYLLLHRRKNLKR